MKNSDDIARRWMEHYDQDEAEAMKNLVNFILRSCGCTTFVDNYQIEDADAAANTLSSIQEEYQETPQTSPDYPLISRKPEYRKLRQQISAFLASLIAHVEAKGLLYEENHPIESLQIWITTMSSSPLRAFRHTSTFVALGIVTNLTEIAADQRKMNVTTRRQLDAESGKSRKNQGRIQSLEKKMKEAEEKIAVIEELIKGLFDGVFVHRYRDVDPKIRTDCVKDLGIWIQRLPDVFFDTQYLRYLGWVLSDTAAATRLEVIKALSRLYHEKDNAAGLRSFTERFRPRIVEMATLDADPHVRVAAIDCMDGIREVGFLEPDDIDKVGMLLFDTDARVRKAVSGFFSNTVEDLFDEKTEELGGSEALDEYSVDVDEDGDEPKVSWLKLKSLVEILAGYDIAEEDDSSTSQGVGTDNVGSSGVKLAGWDSRFSLAGEVLWESLPEVQEWEEVAKYLLHDHSAIDEDDESIAAKLARACALDGKEEVILLYILNTSVEQSLKTGAENPDAVPKKNKKSQADEHRDAVSRQLVKIIPTLLKKFSAVPDSAAIVLRLPQQVDLNVYQELRQETAYSSLLDEINKQFLTHADESVLKEVSMTYLHAKHFDDLAEYTDAKISQLYEETVTTLMETVKGKNVATAQFSDAALTDLINSVRRLDYLSSKHPSIDFFEAPPPGVSEKNRTPLGILMQTLSRASSSDELEEELTVRTLKVLFFYFMWKVKVLRAVPVDDLADTDLDEIQDRRSEILAGISKILETRKDNPLHPVYHATVVTLLDLYIMFMTLRNTFPSPGTSDEENDSPLSRIQHLFPSFTQEQTDLVLECFAHHEYSLSETLQKRLLPNPPIPYPDPLETESDDEEEDTPTVRLQREHALCELTAKVVLAILAGVITNPEARARIAHNKTVLGPAFRDVLAFGLEGGPIVRKKGGRKKKDEDKTKSSELQDDLIEDDLELDEEEMDRELEEFEKQMDEEEEEEGDKEESAEGKEGEERREEEDVEMEDAE